MKEADVVLASILTSEGIIKKRPALVLKIMPKYQDLLLCGISSQINNFIQNFDLIVDYPSKDFAHSGLLKNSVIRLSYLSVIPSQFIEGQIGYITKESHKLLLNRLSEYLIQ